MDDALRHELALQLAFPVAGSHFSGANGRDTNPVGSNGQLPNGCVWVSAQKHTSLVPAFTCGPRQTPDDARLAEARRGTTLPPPDREIVLGVTWLT